VSRNTRFGDSRELLISGLGGFLIVRLLDFLTSCVCVCALFCGMLSVFKDLWSAGCWVALSFRFPKSF